MNRVWAAALLCGSAALAQTVYVVGDSTAANTDGRGWADPFSSYFDASRIQVSNRARAGRSSRTFQTGGLWQRVVDDLKPGDFVLIQFGHNDGGSPDKDRARGSLPGIGDESREYGELVRTYGWSKWAADVAAAEGVPFLDLHERIARRYEALGPEKVEPLFADEHTHTTRAGAEINADVAEALRAAIPALVNVVAAAPPM